MKLDAIAQNPLEWLILKTGMVPTPLGHGHVGFILSRALLDAVDLDVFEALNHKSLDLEELANACGLKVEPLRSLCNILTAAGYMTIKKGKFSLSRKSKKWILKDSKYSVYDLLVLNSRICWSWMEDYKDFLKTGKTIDYHERLNKEDWEVYQKGMAASARVQIPEMLRRTPVKGGAKRMLDIGGSHGLFSHSLCNKYEMLSTILELPEAIKSASQILSAEGDCENVTYKAGNILEDDLREGFYDLILISNLTHHFTVDQNKLIAEKAKKALTKGGHYVMMDFIRPKTRSNADLIGMANDMFFNFTSNGGTYSKEEMKSWIEDVGLHHEKTIRFLTIPGTYQVIGKKV